MKKLLTILLIGFSANTMSAINWHGKINKITAEGGIVKASSCASTDNCKTFWIQPDTELNKVTISMMMVAKTTQSDVWIYASDSDPNASWPIYSAHKISTFQLK